MCGGMEVDSSIVYENVWENGTRNLGEVLVQMLMRAGILFVEVKVVTVGVMVMVAVGVVPFFEKRSLSFNQEEES